jgi:hypothetical protein
VTHPRDRAQQQHEVDAACEIGGRAPRTGLSPGRFLALDHYLEVAKTKPNGLPGATGLARARAIGTLAASHPPYWDALRSARGNAPATRREPTAP